MNVETQSNLPPLSSSESTIIDANQNRRELKASPLLQPQPPLADAGAVDANAINENVGNAATTNIQQLARESGDGASAVGPDVIENVTNANASTNDGRRVLATARNGSLFDDDDDGDDAVNVADDGDARADNGTFDNDKNPTANNATTAGTANTVSSSETPAIPTPTPTSTTTAAAETGTVTATETSSLSSENNLNSTTSAE